jgi:hypothetical protein
MASSMARGGRRRRVLNEEVRTASGLSVTAYHAGGGDADAPRYGEQANVEHHPQVTDFVPRRKRAVLLTLFAGLTTAGAAEALSHFAARIAVVVPGIAANDLAERLAGGAVAWASAVSLIIVALLAKLIFSLRRHRVDDYQGRYRVWRWVAWAAVLGSINSVVQLHVLVAKAAVAVTGMSLSSTGSEWWLAPIAIVGGWIFVRLLLEIGECRSSLAVMLLALACYGLAAAGALGWSSAVLTTWGDALTRVLPLAGHTIALAGLMLFGRYVVLDVQGLIEHAPRTVAPAPAKKKAFDEPAPAKPAVSSNATTHHAFEPKVVAPRQEPSASGYFATGADADDDDEHDGAANRKLSKADRKRLRKQNRAA